MRSRFSTKSAGSDSFTRGPSSVLSGCSACERQGLPAWVLIAPHQTALFYSGRGLVSSTAIFGWPWGHADGFPAQLTFLVEGLNCRMEPGRMSWGLKPGNSTIGYPVVVPPSWRVACSGVTGDPCWRVGEC